jgi:uroporphyrinogen decarboxylase
MNDQSSLERVRAALEHEETRRIPFDLGGAEVTGININALRNLYKHLGINDEPMVLDRITQLASVGPSLRAFLKADVLPVRPNPPSDMNLAKDMGVEDGCDRLIDEFGLGWKMPVQGGHYYDLFHSPLAGMESVKEIESYPWPDPLDPGRFAGVADEASCIINQEKKAIICGRMSSGMWEHAMWLRGYEQFFMDMVMDKPMVTAIMEKLLEINMAYWGRYLDEVGDNALVISCADDLGSTNGLLVSLEMYKEQIWPYHKRLFEFIKKRASSKVYIFFHNDGAIYETLPLLIEAGVDIINPWQVNCKGMDDTAKFKKEFGQELTVWGGTCNAPTLEFGSIQEVKDETKRRIEDLAPGGGFIAAPIHVIQGGVPPGNIMAWWETIQSYQR